MALISLWNPSWLVRSFHSIFGILGCIMDGLADHLPMGKAIATQFIRFDLSGLTVIDYCT
jgi:hypothetical protein